MKLLKLIALLFLLMVIVVVAAQIFDYWSGLAYFTLTSSAFIGFFHLLILGMLAWAFFSLIKYKV